MQMQDGDDDSLERLLHAMVETVNLRDWSVNVTIDLSRVTRDSSRQSAALQIKLGWMMMVVTGYGCQLVCWGINTRDAARSKKLQLQSTALRPSRPLGSWARLVWRLTS